MMKLKLPPSHPEHHLELLIISRVFSFRLICHLRLDLFRIVLNKLFRCGNALLCKICKIYHIRHKRFILFRNTLAGNRKFRITMSSRCHYVWNDRGRDHRVGFFHLGIPRDIHPVFGNGIIRGRYDLHRISDFIHRLIHDRIAVIIG